MPYQSLGRAVIFALLSGVLMAASASLHPIWWAAWLAPAPVLAAVCGRSLRAGFALGCLAGLIGSLAFLPYFLGIVGVVPALIIVVMRAAAQGFAVALAARALFGGVAASRFGRIWPVFVYPLAIAGLDTVNSAVSLHGTVGSLAYSQMEAIIVLQAASLGGTPLVAFLPSVAGCVLALAMINGKAARAGVAAGLGVLGLVLGFGLARLAYAPANTFVPVALMASDTGPGIEADHWAETAARYMPDMTAAADVGARIIVLPEKIAALHAPQQTQARADIAALARGKSAMVVAGILALDGDSQANRAIVGRPNGDVQTYDKQHLVPGFEAQETPGHTPLAVDAPWGRTGIAICKDMDFAALGREYARLGVRVMVVPAWDFAGGWGEDGYAHGRMAVLRAVEGGFTLVRAARQGRLTVSDRYGRVLAEAPSADPIGRLLVPAPIPPAGGTVYARIGDVFGWAAVALTLLACGLVTRKSRSAV